MIVAQAAAPSAIPSVWKCSLAFVSTGTCIPDLSAVEHPPLSQTIETPRPTMEMITGQPWPTLRDTPEGTVIL
jgi:hypothetical protein